MESSQSSLDLFPHKRNFYNMLIMNRAKQRHYHYTNASSISTSRQMIISRNFTTKTHTTPSITSTVAAITTDTHDKAKAKKKQRRKKRKTKIFNFDTRFPPSKSQRHRLTTREYLYHRIPCDYNHPVTLSQRDVFLTKQRVTALGSEALEFIGTNLSNAKEYVQEALFGDVMKAQKRLENYNTTNTNTYNNNNNMEGIRERRGPLFNQRWWRWNIGVRALIPLSVFVFLHFKEKEMIEYYESVSEDEKKRLFHLYGLDNDDEVDQVENGSIDTVNNILNNVNESTRSTNNDLLENQKTTTATTTATISSDDTNGSILLNKLMERINSLEEKLESERKKSRARDNILRGQIIKSQSSSGIQNRVDDQKVAKLSAAAAASDESDINDKNDDGIFLDQSFVENFMHEKFESTKKHVVNSGKEYLDNVFEYLKSNSHSPFEKQNNNTKDNNSISNEKNNIEERNSNVLVTTTNPTLVTHNVNTNKNNSTVVEETLSQTDQDDEEERRIEKPQRSFHYLKQKLYKLLSKINLYHDKSTNDHPNTPLHDNNDNEKREK